MTDKDADSFSLWVHELMHEHDLTQDAVARKVGVSHQTVSLWIAGATVPGYHMLVRLVRAFRELPPDLRLSEKSPRS